MEDTDWQPLAGVDKHCFGCGCDNTNGLQMTFATNGTQVRTALTIKSDFRGWSRLVHGGVLATILDETMSWTTIILTKHFILTKEMTVRFLRPVYIESAITCVGTITEHRGDRTAIVTAELFNDKQKLCAYAVGEFVLYTQEQFAKLGILPETELQAMASII